MQAHGQAPQGSSPNPAELEQGRRQRALQAAQLVAFEPGQRSAAGEGDPASGPGPADDGYGPAGAREVVQCLVEPLGGKSCQQRPRGEGSPRIEPPPRRTAPHRARTRRMRSDSMASATPDAPAISCNPAERPPSVGSWSADAPARAAARAGSTTEIPGMSRADRAAASTGAGTAARHFGGRTPASTAAPSTRCGSYLEDSVARTEPPGRHGPLRRDSKHLPRPRAAGVPRPSPRCVPPRELLLPRRARAASPRRAPPHRGASILRAAARTRETIADALLSPRRRSH